jgi:hypothetical protein
MPKFQDIAVVAGTGKSAGRVREALEGGADSDIAVNAWLAFEAVLTAAQRDHAEEIPDVEDGMPWLRWHGSLATVLRDLGMINRDFSKENAEDGNTRRTVNAYLKRTGNAICVYRTNGLGGAKPIWAVRSTFRETPVKHGQINMKALGKSPGEPGAQHPNDILPVKRMRCIECTRFVSVDYALRHMSQLHGLDPQRLVFEAIKQRHTHVRSSELAQLLSDACGGGVISTAYINKMLKPHADNPASPITITRPFGDFWYNWDESITVITPITPITPDVTPLPPAAEPTPAAPAATVAVFTPTPPSQNGSATPAKSTAPDVRLGVLALAFERVEEAIQVVYNSLDEAKMAAEEIAAENQELRGYRERVKSLLAGAAEAGH